MYSYAMQQATAHGIGVHSDGISVSLWRVRDALPICHAAGHGEDGVQALEENPVQQHLPDGRLQG